MWVHNKEPTVVYHNTTKGERKKETDINITQKKENVNLSIKNNTNFAIILLHSKKN